jgi:hypothetical protein
MITSKLVHTSFHSFLPSLFLAHTSVEGERENYVLYAIVGVNKNGNSSTKSESENEIKIEKI